MDFIAQGHEFGYIYKSLVVINQWMDVTKRKIVFSRRNRQKKIRSGEEISANFHVSDMYNQKVNLLSRETRTKDTNF